MGGRVGQPALARDLEPDVGQPSVSLFIDESKPSPRDHPRHESWSYIGVLVVPTPRVAEAVEMLNDDRRRVGYHNELHFTGVKQAAKQSLAEMWLDHVMCGRDRLFFFNLLGIDRQKLDSRRFGPDRRSQELGIHRRFVRTTVASGLRRFFSSGVAIDAIYHDRAEVEYDALFDWHTPWRLNRDFPGIDVRPARVMFVDSDHWRCDPEDRAASHLIQLADVTLGAFRQCLDGTSAQPRKRALGHRVAPLLQRLTDQRQRSNPNSRFDHLGRLGVSFFPSSPPDIESLAVEPVRPESEFYFRRDLLGAPDGGQLRLDL